MLKFLKKHIISFFNLMFIIYLILLFIFLLNDNTDAMPVLLFIEMLYVLAILVEMIYYIVHAIKHKEIKDHYLYAFLIYLFNIFYIPCYRYKYILKEKNYKKLSITYVITSIVLFIVMFGVMCGVVLNNTDNNRYCTDDNFICMKLPSDYKKLDLEAFDYYYQSQDTTVGVFVYDDESFTEEEVLQFHVSDMKGKRDDVVQIDSYTKEKNGKHYSTETYKGKYQDNYFVYTISSMTFKERDNYIIAFIIVTPESDYSHNKSEINRILKNVNINS